MKRLYCSNSTLTTHSEELSKYVDKIYNIKLDVLDMLQEIEAHDSNFDEFDNFARLMRNGLEDLALAEGALHKAQKLI